VAKKDATLLAEKSCDNSMLRIRLVGHLDMMPESPTRIVGAAPKIVRCLSEATSAVSLADRPP
jgi:hypothetical protein